MEFLVSLQCNYFKDGKVARYSGQRNVASFKIFIDTTEPNELFVLKPLIPEKPLELEGGPTLATKVNDSNDVINFNNEETFENTIKTGLWVIKFHIGSGFDLDLQPIFQSVAAHFKTKQSHIKFGKINVYDKEALMQKI